MEQWSEIRRRVLTREISKRQACREYGIHWETLRKIEGNVEPPAFRRSSPRARPVLAAYLGHIQALLKADESEPVKQRHTARRIYHRLRDERGYQGGESTVRQAISKLRQQTAEVFVPLCHPPGEVQVDFGHAEVIFAGERVKALFFVMTLPYSDAFFCCVFPKECTETFVTVR